MKLLWYAQLMIFESLSIMQLKARMLLMLNVNVNPAEIM